MKHSQLGAARTWGIAGLIIGAVMLWMLSGIFGNKHGAAPANTEAVAAELAVAAPKEHFKVAAHEQSAENIQREVVINGDTGPDQVINIASQVEGQVVAIGARKGARVKQGELLARIDPRDLEQQKQKAAAVMHQRELEYQAAAKLHETGYVTEGELAGKQAALEVARADVKNIELRLSNLNITAPVSGILEDQHVEVGDYAKIGQPVARLIKTDPLTVSGGAGENDIRYIHKGDSATAEILGGAKLNGHVKFVSSMADPRTRTFTVEVAVDNRDNKIPAGLSAKIIIPAQTISAHRIPASLLTLADNGAVGVKHIVDGRVQFTKTEIVRAAGDAVYVTGLPEKILLITRGQGFVAAGETVEIEAEKTAQAAPASQTTAQ